MVYHQFCSQCKNIMTKEEMDNFIDTGEKRCGSCLKEHAQSLKERLDMEDKNERKDN